MSYYKTKEQDDLEKIEKGFFILLVLILILVAPLSFLIGAYIEHKRMTQQAVEHNVAEWTVDSKTGRVEFKYKICSFDVDNID
jgi:hypothetical protein